MKKNNFNPNKILLQNFFSLGILHTVNYILPLLTIPFLVRVLHPEYYGLIAYSSSIISILILLTDYGFNLTATREVSLNRSNNIKLNQIFSSVLTVKLFLVITCLCLIFLSVNSIPKLKEYSTLYYLHFGMVIGSFLQPLWLFQGLERMKYITIIDVGIKTVFTLSLFFFISGPEDFLVVPIIYSLSSITSGLFTLIFAYKKFNLRISIPPFSTIKDYIFDGWHIFVSNLGVNLYTNGTIFILGFITNNTTVGYFAATEKIVRAMRKLYAPIGQALFPSIGYRIEKDKTQGIDFLRKSGTIISIIMLIISSLIFLYAKDIVTLLLGNQYNQSIILLKIMAFIPFTYTINNLIGVQMLVNLGHGKIYGIIISVISIAGLISGYTLIKSNGIEGAAYNLVLVELLSLFSLLFLSSFLHKKNYKL